MSRTRQALRAQPFDGAAAPPRRGLTAAGRTDPGLQRQVNEDRLHVDVARGLFIVIDGVGGHAAGGKAADVALSLVRERLERETGTVADRIREAITIANNEIFRLASTRPEWDGMACVLTIAVVDDGTATIGHVGDTRLYKLRGGSLDKITHDHSPVGEREDAQELSEWEAMRHPRRNEVYRDVGSDLHEPSDPEFVDVQEVPFEPDAALLICSDGLTDLVDSSTIVAKATELAGQPAEVVAALVDAANTAGGKDNITVVYVEGEQFAPVPQPRKSAAGQPRSERRPRQGTWTRVMRLVIVGLLLVVVAIGVAWRFELLPALQSASIIPVAPRLDPLVVQPGGSIAAALARAVPGSQVVVEPGEYREQLTLRDHVRVVSRVPGGASLRLPVTASDGAAVVASGLTSAELVGFRIVGDAATPLGVGILLDASALSIVDVEITGATRAGVEFVGGRGATLLASTIHDNPGAAIVIRGNAAPRIAHNTFRRNGVSEHAPGAFAVDLSAAPVFRDNVFVGTGDETLAVLERAARSPLSDDNWFIGTAAPVPVRPPARTSPAPRAPQGKR